MVSKAVIRILLAVSISAVAVPGMLGPVLLADEPEPAQPSAILQAARTPEKAAAGKVYTNEDLQKMFGLGGSAPAPETEPAPATPAARAPAAAAQPAPSGTAAPTPAAAPLDPLQQLQAEQKRLADRASAIAAAEKKVAEAQTRIQDLEKRVLATKNPFMARPDVPAEEREQWEKLNGAERVNKSEEVLRDARQALADAQSELQRLRSNP